MATTVRVKTEGAFLCDANMYCLLSIRLYACISSLIERPNDFSCAQALDLPTPLSSHAISVSFCGSNSFVSLLSRSKFDLGELIH